MALCRCKQKHGNPIGRVEQYVTSVEPIGYPKTSSICGIATCENPGLIWLTKSELKEYQNGTRIFSYANRTTKVHVR